jgi:drug/metabolite transporter (DMT)-like permease
VLAALTAGVVAIVAAIDGPPPFPTSASLGWTAAAGVCEAGYFLSLVRGLSAGPLGPVYTVSRGGAILLVWPISITAFGEPITAFAIGGSVLVLAGLAAIGFGRQTTRAAIGWGAACAVFIAGYHLLYKMALAEHASAPAVFAVSLAIATPINALRLRRRLGAIARSVAARPLPYLGAGAVCAASFLLFLIALRDGGAGAVLTLRNTSVLFATAFGLALGERPTRLQWIGASLVVAGALLLAR